MRNSKKKMYTMEISFFFGGDKTTQTSCHTVRIHEILYFFVSFWKKYTFVTLDSSVKGLSISRERYRFLRSSSIHSVYGWTSSFERTRYFLEHSWSRLTKYRASFWDAFLLWSISSVDIQETLEKGGYNSWFGLVWTWTVVFWSIRLSQERLLSYCGRRLPRVLQSNVLFVLLGESRCRVKSINFHLDSDVWSWEFGVSSHYIYLR